MIFSVPLIILVSLLISGSNTYDFSVKECKNLARQQSPINIVSSSSIHLDEKYFRFLSNNYNPLTTDYEWTYYEEYYEEEKAVGIASNNTSSDLGNFIFVKDWAMYSFNLQKILFRVNSEHRIDGQNFDVEMQLVHTYEPNYYAPGRKIDLEQDYLVISVFFKRTPDENPAASKLFEFADLRGFFNGTTTRMSRNIKLHYIIQHQPSYLYTGSLTFPECQDAIWLLFSQYHLISETDYSRLLKVIQKRTTIVDPLSLLNTRILFPSLPSTQVYRNWNELSMLSPKPTLMAYNSASYVHINYLIFISLFLLFLMI